MKGEKSTLNGKNAKTERILEIKAEILCWGIKPGKHTEELYALQNPCRDFKTGNVGIHIVLGSKIAVLATISHQFDMRSPYAVERDGRVWRLYKNNEFCSEFTPIPRPKWYDHKTSSGVPMPEIFLHEGLYYIHQAGEGCGYFTIDKECKFCAAGKKWKISRPGEVGEVVDAAYQENPSYQVCLGGGTKLFPDKGAIYFRDCLKEIRRRVAKVPVWIEMVPPDSDTYIEMLIDAGATSFGFNIEIWDDNLRKEICPGKYYVSKKRYSEAFEFVLKKLGPSKVGSVLIVGLEDPKSTAKGIEELAGLGVQPCLLPFKPWSGSSFEKLPPADPEMLIQTSKLSAEFMLKYQINPFENQGCLHCSSCTIDHDYFAILTNRL